MSSVTDENLPFYAVTDSMSLADAERFALALARFRPGDDTEAGMSGGRRGRTLLDVLGVDDARVLDTERLWASRWSPGRDFWRFPVGLDEAGDVVYMDLKQSADDGYNGSGTIIGTTGSGKSVTLLTVLESLLLTHSPQVASAAFFDLKAKSIGQIAERSPNVIAAVSNLGEERHLIRRMHLALEGFVERRKAACVAAGCVDMNDYNERIARGADLPRLPALLVIVDEFNELPAVYPEIFDFFDTLVRQGRAYHISLLLVGQKFEDNSLVRKVADVLGWRIALRTGTEEASRKVINDAIAYRLRSHGDEGVGYLRVGSDPLRQLKFFNTRAKYVAPVVAAEREVVSSGDWFTPREFTAVPAADPDGRMAPPPLVEPEAAPVVVDDPTAPGELDIEECEAVFDTLTSAGVGRAEVDFWLPPLKDGLAADELVARLRGRPWYEEYGNNPGLLLPFGQEDRPRDCTQPVFAVDVSTEHVAVAGGKQSGLTTALMTAVVGGSLMYDPRWVQFYCVNGGGADLMKLRRLPNVAAMADKSDEAGVRRVFEAVIDIIEDRTKAFIDLEISAADFFAARAADPAAFPQIAGGHVVVVVDGYVSLKETFNDPRDEWYVPAMLKIVTDGLSAGVHLVVSSDSWANDFNMKVQDRITAKFELRLANSTGSIVNRKEHEMLPTGSPGWGLSRAGHWLRTGLPRMRDAQGRVVDESAGLAAAIEERTGTAAPVAMAKLPADIEWTALRDKAPAESLPVALWEKELSAKCWDWRQDPHIYAIGARGSGRTTFLRTLCRAISEAFTPEQAQLHVIDLRRQLVGAVSQEHIGSYSVTISAAKEAMAELIGLLQARTPPGGAGPEVLRDRLWDGPELFVVIDNMELLSHMSPEYPFGPVRHGAPPLYELVQQGSELGLHIVCTAQLSPAFTMAAAQNPLLRMVRQMDSPTVLFSGARDIGPVIHHVRPQHQRKGVARWVERNGSSVETVLVGWTPEPPQTGNFR